MYSRDNLHQHTPAMHRFTVNIMKNVIIILLTLNILHIFILLFNFLQGFYPLQIMKCCQGPMNYTIRVYQQGKNSDLYFVGLMFLFGVALPLTTMLIGIVL